MTPGVKIPSMADVLWQVIAANPVLFTVGALLFLGTIGLQIWAITTAPARLAKRREAERQDLAERIAREVSRR